MKSINHILIRGRGVVSAIGDGYHSFVSALFDGRSAKVSSPTGAPHSSFDPKRTFHSKPLRPYDRTSLFAIAAIEEALHDFDRRDSLGLVLGTTFSSAKTMAQFDRRCLERGPAYASPMDFANSVINAASGQAAIWHRLEGLNSTLTGGMSVGLRAILHACDVLRSGRAEHILAGGVDELSDQSQAALQQAGLIDTRGREDRTVPFDQSSTGLCPGEGAAIVLLELRNTALGPEQRQAEIALLGYSVRFDPQRGRSEAPLRECLTSTILSALDNAECHPDEVDAISAAACGPQHGDRIEAAAIIAAFGASRAQHLPICTVKAGTGEPFGAGGALQVLAGSAMIEQQQVPGIVGWQSSPLPLGGLSSTSRTTSSPIRRVLVESFDDDGCCCAAVLGTL